MDIVSRVVRLKNALSNSRQCAIIPNSIRANAFFVGPTRRTRSEFAVVEILIQTLNRRDSIVTRNRVPGECAGQISCKSDLNLSSPLSRDNLHPLPLLPSSSSTERRELIRPNTSHLSHEKSFPPFLFPFVASDRPFKRERKVESWREAGEGNGRIFRIISNMIDL